MAAGSILLCAAIMFSGASPTKVLHLLSSVNTSVPSTSCYMVYQKGSLVPVIKKVRKKGAFKEPELYGICHFTGLEGYTDEHSGVPERPGPLPAWGWKVQFPQSLGKISHTVL